MPSDIKTYWAKQQKRVDVALKKLLPPTTRKPATIHKAMHYSIFAGGKRLRPILVLASAEAVGGAKAATEALPLACAVECIHTYSLIHDDLPCMDDDDLRRGKPTSHKVYGEGIAVLAGDALNTEAFAMAATVKGWPRYKTADVVKELAYAAGSQRLIGGQVVDLECEGQKKGMIKPSQLKYIHQNKTAALIASSIRLGAMAGNATKKQLDDLTEFGEALGLAFQVIDDILDIESTTEQLGKSQGKDLTSEKATYPSILGMDKAKAEARRLTKLAESKVEAFKAKGEHLRGISKLMLERKS